MAIKAGIGIGTDRNPLAAVQNALRQAKTNIQTEKIDLAVVFSTIEFADSSVLKTIKNLLGPVSLVGCSTLGIISNQGIFRRGLSILLLSFPRGVFCNTAYVKDINAKSMTDAGEELGQKLLYGFKNVQRDFSILFSDGLLRDTSNLIYGLRERMGLSFPMAGASASDNLEFKKTYVYFNDEALSGATCGILFGGKSNFGLGVQHGWKPLGRPRQVTKAAGNIIYEIDGAPAADVYKEYFNYGIADLKRELKRISILYPLGIYLAGEEEYLLRNIISIEDDSALACQGDVPAGSLIRLMIGTKESCLAACEQAAEEAKNQLLGRAPSFLFVFDSASRYALLGRQAHREIEIIKERLGKDTPIMGMYTYGEQAPLKAVRYYGKTYFHNQTISILGIGG